LFRLYRRCRPARAWSIDRGPFGERAMDILKLLTIVGVWSAVWLGIGAVLAYGA
jgi:hypothetical protein